jgi:hypothetical protein
MVTITASIITASVITASRDYIITASVAYVITDSGAYVITASSASIITASVITASATTTSSAMTSAMTCCKNIDAYAKNPATNYRQHDKNILSHRNLLVLLKLHSVENLIRFLF